MPPHAALLGPRGAAKLLVYSATKGAEVRARHPRLVSQAVLRRPPTVLPTAMIPSRLVKPFRRHHQTLRATPHTHIHARQMAMTRSLANLCVSKGIRVNAVAPGPIWTPLIPATFPSERRGAASQGPLAAVSGAAAAAASGAFAGCAAAQYCVRIATSRS